MEVISRVAIDSIVDLYKKFIQGNNVANYHFMPEYVVNKVVANGDIIETLKYLLGVSWGNWTPQAGETLRQTIICRHGDITCNIHLILNEVNIRVIYIRYNDLSKYVTDNRSYIATNGYHTQLCDTDGSCKFNLIEPLYKSSDAYASGPWSKTLIKE